VEHAESDERPERKRMGRGAAGEAARACVAAATAGRRGRPARRPVVRPLLFRAAASLRKPACGLADRRPSSRRSSLSRVHWTRSSAVAPLRQIASHSRPAIFGRFKAPPAFTKMPSAWHTAMRRSSYVSEPSMDGSRPRAVTLGSSPARPRGAFVRNRPPGIQEGDLLNARLVTP